MKIYMKPEMKFVEMTPEEGFAGGSTTQSGTPSITTLPPGWNPSTPR